ncbi:MAG: 2-oxoacid:ferredoxin oxidoreductase subunit beta [Candidatus Methylomirabilales bacterium]
MSEVATPTLKLTRKDFMSDQEVRWCPGCGDYAILAQMQKVLPELGIPRDQLVFVSGIGCASRFPYYMNTYGFHTIHGRAPAIATGLKISRPELHVWVVTGDGDGLSIGGNHLIHALRRNIDVKILLFNNRIYGLTKGQYSPTSELGKVTKSTPFGSLDYPLNPIEIALGAEATFVARSVDVETKHLQETLKRAHEHKGSAFIEILQNCNVFNDGAWEPITDRATKGDHQLVLEQGKPLVFGKNREKGIRLGKDMNPEIVTLGDGVDASQLLLHDETNPSMAYILSRLGPQFPTPIGVFRVVKRMTYDEGANAQIESAKKRLGPGDLEAILNRGDTWVVK